MIRVVLKLVSITLKFTQLSPNPHLHTTLDICIQASESDVTIFIFQVQVRHISICMQAQLI